MSEQQKSKRFQTYLIVNWKNNKMRLIKKRPKDIGPFELPIKLDITLKIPKFKDIVAKGEVEIPQHRVEDMVIESI